MRGICKSTFLLHILNKKKSLFLTNLHFLIELHNFLLYCSGRNAPDNKIKNDVVIRVQLPENRHEKKKTRISRLDLRAQKTRRFLYEGKKSLRVVSRESHSPLISSSSFFFYLLDYSTKLRSLVPPLRFSHYQLRFFKPLLLQQIPKNIFTWEDNKAVLDLMATKAEPIVKRTTVPLPGGFEAQTRMIIPPDADLTGLRKYPMLVYVWVC